MRSRDECEGADGLQRSTKLSLPRVNRSCILGGSVLLIVCVVAVLAPYIAPFPPSQMDITNMMSRPTRTHWFGTDAYGRDVASRVVYGARISLRVGFTAAILTVVTGLAIGLLAGSLAHADNLLMRLMDALMSLPTIVLALAIVSALGPSENTVIIALSITYTPRMARVIRATVLSLRGQAFIEAAHAIGASKTRILLRHMLVNCIGPAITQGSFFLAYALMAEATLSFLGVGPRPPAPSWGNMMSEARDMMDVTPWIMVFPGAAIFVSVLGINLLGDGVRDLFDPKYQRRRRAGKAAQ